MWGRKETEGDIIREIISKAFMYEDGETCPPVPKGGHPKNRNSMLAETGKDLEKALMGWKDLERAIRQFKEIF